jgi:hypothetical protein
MKYWVNKNDIDKEILPNSSKYIEVEIIKFENGMYTVQIYNKEQSNIGRFFILYLSLSFKFLRLDRVTK